MINMPLAQLAKVVSGTIHTPSGSPHDCFTGVSIDTRTLTAGNLFVALKGPSHDGHHFLNAATEKKASMSLVEHEIPSSLPQIIVKDTLTALGQLSAFWRDQFDIPLIGITGSNGKTTLKNMLASILVAASNSHKNNVLATDGNRNNQIGVPLTLFRLHKEHRWGAIEMGMNHFGEIAYLTNLVKPTIAIITNAAEAHLEGLSSVAGIAKAKGEIFLGTNPQGTAILNCDDPFFAYWKSLIGTRPYLTFGFQPEADVTGTFTDLKHTVFHTPAGEMAITLPLLGKHNIMNALAATAAALALSIDLSFIKQGIENTTPAPGRMQSYDLANGAHLIDDTYNANPFSVRAAIQTLRTFHGTKIVVLGDMKELGSDAKEIHRDMGKKIREENIDYLFTYGELSSATSEAFGENAFHFTEQKTLLTTLRPYLKKDVNVLVKGSRSMKMEKIILAIIPNETEHMQKGE